MYPNNFFCWYQSNECFIKSIQHLQNSVSEVKNSVDNLEDEVTEIQNEISQVPTCYNPVYNLINYTFYYVPTEQPNPEVNFYNININNSYNGDRIWNFVFGGQTNNAVYSCVFQFDPNCSLPNGFNSLKLSELTFFKPGSTLLEPFQGYIVINNVPIGISGPGPNPQSKFQTDPLYNVVNILWEPTIAKLTLNINLGNATVGWATLFNPPLPPPNPSNMAITTQRLERQFNWQPPIRPNTYFVNISIHDIPVGLG